MLFYVQMKWNHEGRISLDDLWEVEALEAEHAQETLDSGFCVGIWKVAAQKRVMAIIDSETHHPLLGFIGDPTVNVLAVNRALDARYPAAQPKTS